MPQNLVNIPTSHVNLFHKLLIELNRDITIEAIIGYGSFFQKENSKNSDIDIVVLTKRSIHQKKLLQIEKQDFEVFYFGVEKFATILKNFDECYVPAMANGTIVYDPNQLAIEVINAAKTIYRKGPRDLLKDTMFMNKLRSRARTHLLDMKDSVSNPILFNVCHYRLLFIIYRLICMQYKEWERSPKKMFDHVALLSTHLHDMLIISLSNINHKTRVEASEKLIEELLAPHGGLLQPNEIVFY
ncbi:nucleotidyltransferase domain-containing protein [Pseudocolwellia agarivorans]|uniref:nucleotidyltransferase domain-containing protein n=1 Tax=Pseudocolwellia agarivorans TaxID=1911682 RepID=UPI0009877AC6|nr:nucleotidyltransferase domain-containing protein [Pseudocolwellia agarivorans]